MIEIATTTVTADAYVRAHVERGRAIRSALAWLFGRR